MKMESDKVLQIITAFKQVFNKYKLEVISLVMILFSVIIISSLDSSRQFVLSSQAQNFPDCFGKTGSVCEGVGDNNGRVTVLNCTGEVKNYTCQRNHKKFDNLSVCYSATQTNDFKEYVGMAVNPGERGECVVDAYGLCDIGQADILNDGTFFGGMCWDIMKVCENCSQITPTLSPTPTSVNTLTPTKTPTPTRTLTPTKTPTISPTITPTPTKTLTPTPTKTLTPVPTVPTKTPTPTRIPTQTLRPTITPTVILKRITVQGRIYEDLDVFGNVGRGAWADEIPACYRTPCYSLGKTYTVPVRIDLSTNSGYKLDIANNPNTTDICSVNQEEEKEYCGWANPVYKDGKIYPGSHCSKYGGFSLTISPQDKPKIYNLGGKNYYLIRVVVAPEVALPGSAPYPLWKIWGLSEAYWFNAGTVSPPSPLPAMPYQDNSPTGVVRCDLFNDSVQCNVCKGGVTFPSWANICRLNSTTGHLQEGLSNCSLNTYRSGNTFGYWAGILVPIDAGTQSNNLWIGIAKR